jgi:hypothetical protein
MRSEYQAHAAIMAGLANKKPAIIRRPQCPQAINARVYVAAFVAVIIVLISINGV